MKPDYDETIISHYNKIAEEYGLSSRSTMEDEIVRKKETTIIRDFVEHVAYEWRIDFAQNGEYATKKSGDKDLIILDVGCGNGYTIKCLAGDLTSYSYIGVEYNDKLRDLALQQVTGMANVRVLPGDLRVRETINIKNESVDILLCQRVLINLASHHDTKLALNNILSLVKSNGRLLFIEAFSSGLANLNNARASSVLNRLVPLITTNTWKMIFFLILICTPVQCHLLIFQRIFFPPTTMCRGFCMPPSCSNCSRVIGKETLTL